MTGKRLSAVESVLLASAGKNPDHVEPKGLLPYYPLFTIRYASDWNRKA
jgi:hypothetical protein